METCAPHQPPGSQCASLTPTTSHNLADNFFRFLKALSRSLNIQSCIRANNLSSQPLRHKALDMFRSMRKTGYHQPIQPCSYLDQARSGRTLLN